MLAVLCGIVLALHRASSAHVLELIIVGFAAMLLIVLFSLSNDSIRISNLKEEEWDQIEYVTEGGEKNLKRWPGVLIGRLGTNIPVSFAR